MRCGFSYKNFRSEKKSDFQFDLLQMRAKNTIKIWKQYAFSKNKESTIEGKDPANANSKFFHIHATQNATKCVGRARYEQKPDNDKKEWIF